MKNFDLYFCLSRARPSFFLPSKPVIKLMRLRLYFAKLSKASILSRIWVSTITSPSMALTSCTSSCNSGFEPRMTMWSGLTEIDKPDAGIQSRELGGLMTLNSYMILPLGILHTMHHQHSQEALPNFIYRSQTHTRYSNITLHCL